MKTKRIGITGNIGSGKSLVCKIFNHLGISTFHSDEETKKLYYILSTILYFLQTVNPKNTFGSRFTQLIDKYPQVDLNAMGFPNNWQKEPLWNNT